jgi:branched-chain amino acid transport system ATP-binding protein
MPLLEVKNATKRFGGLTAVSDLTFEMDEGAIVSVIGPNGAGKTTFFNCIAGFYRIDEGSITLDGTELSDLRPDTISKLGLARTYQNIRLFGSMTALENVLVGEHQHLRSTWLHSVLRTKSVKEEERAAAERAHDLLDYVGLSRSHDLMASNLPYGDQRRLEIARALGTQPRLLLLDEPTAGMNPAETQEMTGLIRRLRDDMGISVLLIEHEMRVVMGISERITVLDYGQRIAEGTPTEIQKNARVIEAYLGKQHSEEIIGEYDPDEDDEEAARMAVAAAAADTEGAMPEAGKKDVDTTPGPRDGMRDDDKRSDDPQMKKGG